MRVLPFQQMVCNDWNSLVSSQISYVAASLCASLFLMGLPWVQSSESLLRVRARAHCHTHLAAQQAALEDRNSDLRRGEFGRPVYRSGFSCAIICSEMFSEVCRECILEHCVGPRAKPYRDLICRQNRKRTQGRGIHFDYSEDGNLIAQAIGSPGEAVTAVTTVISIMNAVTNH